MKIVINIVMCLSEIGKRIGVEIAQFTRTCTNGFVISLIFKALIFLEIF